MFFNKWKFLVTIAILSFATVLFVYDIVLNKENKIFGKGLKLGLDLMGGSSVVLEIDSQYLKKDIVEKTSDSLVEFFMDERLSYSELTVKDNSISFKIFNKEDLYKIRQFLNDNNKLIEVSENNMLVSVVLTSAFYEYKLLDVMEKTIEIIRKRVDSIGTNEPSIKRRGNNQIIVDMPGVNEPEKIKRILGTTAKLTFNMVDYGSTFQGENIPFGYQYVESVDNSYIKYSVKVKADLDGDAVVESRLEYYEGSPAVFFKFNKKGAKIFADLTKDNVGNLFAIVLDDKVLSAPKINTPILGGSGVITGNFTVIEAQELSLLIQAGSLPVPLKIVEERTVGPTLGIESIKAGTMAAIFGFFLVFVFMIAFYRKLGVIANIVLLINVGLLLVMLSIVGATLTLPGIAGIILTMGMAVDANILVYERLRDELNNSGGDLGFAMSKSFDRVFLTIFDSNITTLFTALFLFYFGDGPVRGFAVTLMIGIICSMFCIMFVTKMIIAIFYRKWFKVVE
jgi:preprotein translocase subunit SecD